jgi:hypothetical protein
VIDEAASPLFAYRRRGDTESITVIVNLSSSPETAPEAARGGEVVLANYGDGSPNLGELRPWELVVLRR